jgi:hypothetical protein
MSVGKYSPTIHDIYPSEELHYLKFMQPDSEIYDEDGYDMYGYDENELDRDGHDRWYYQQEALRDDGYFVDNEDVY